MGAHSYEDLIRHVGHKIVCVKYADGQNVAVECEDCYEVIIDFDIPEYRESDLYKSMTPSLAITIVELLPEDYLEWQRLVTWQWLLDNRYDLIFQGEYGRTMKRLLEKGLIER